MQEVWINSFCYQQQSVTNATEMKEVEKWIQSHKVCHKVVNRKMVPSWYTGCEQECSTQLVCRNIMKLQAGMRKGSEGLIEQPVKHREEECFTRDFLNLSDF